MWDFTEICDYFLGFAGFSWLRRKEHKKEFAGFSWLRRKEHKKEEGRKEEGVFLNEKETKCLDEVFF